MKSGKVWGTTEILMQSPIIEIHRIIINKGGFCSNHKHEFKWNMFYVIKGTLQIFVHKNNYDLVDITELVSGEYTTIKPGEYHSFKAVSDVYALEIYYPELLSEDIVRKTVGGRI